MDELPTQNLGVIQGRRNTDYLGGTIPYEVVLESGDWRPYLPKGENQYSNVADFMACVSFSNDNDAQIQLKQQGEDWDGSDRWLAKTSGTTHDGNYLYKVADVPRNIGRVREEDYPTPPGLSWDAYYAPIPDEVNKKAIKFEEAYEWIGTDAATLKYHLKQAPIQITIPHPHPNHAVVLVHVEGNTAYYFDSYPGTTNYLKTMDVSLISDALKIVIKKKSMPKKFYVDDKGTISLVVIDGFAVGGATAKTPEAKKQLEAALEFTGNEPTIKLS